MIILVIIGTLLTLNLNSENKKTSEVKNIKKEKIIKDKLPSQYPENVYLYASEGPIGGPRNYCSS